MMKRYGITDDYYNAKKAKLSIGVASTSTKNDNNLDDDVWGEDIDEDEAEELLTQATQACSSSYRKTDASIMPSYDTFKPPRSVATSTQQRFVNQNSLDMNLTRRQMLIVNEVVDDRFTNENLKKELEKLKAENKGLKDKCWIKEGEVTILRNQLKKAEVNVDNMKVEKMKAVDKAQQEWAEKLNSINTELNRLKTEMGFKDFEILNVKERCRTLESTKVKIINCSQKLDTEKESTTGQPFFKDFVRTEKSNINSSCQTDDNFDYVLRFPSNTCLPLLKRIPEDIFQDSEHEVAVLKISHKTECRNISPFTKNGQCSLTEKPPASVHHVTLMNDDDPLSIRYFYPDLSKLLKFNQKQLQSTEARWSVNKIIFVTYELLLNTLKMLESIRNSMLSEDIRTMDTVYLDASIQSRLSEHKLSIFDAKHWYDHEKAIESRRSLGVLATVAKHSAYIADYIAVGTVLKTDDDVAFRADVKYFKQIAAYSQRHSTNGILNALMDIATLIDDTRQAYQFSGLLTAIVELLIGILNNSESRVTAKKTMFRIVKRIVFSRPIFKVLVSVVVFLNAMSNDVTFCNLLCNNSSQNTFKKETTQGLIFFNNDTCVMQVLCTLLSAHNSDVETLMILNITCNLVGLFYNLIQSQVEWITTTENRRCHCLRKLSNCTVKWLFIVAKLFNKNIPDFEDITIASEARSILKRGVILLHVLQYRDANCTINDHYEYVVRTVMRHAEDFELDNIHRTAFEEILGIYEAELQKINSIQVKKASTSSFQSFEVFE